MKTDALAEGSPFTAMFELGDPNGLRVAVKDCIDIAAMTTRCGSASLADAPAARKHAVVVDRILDARCQIVGKTRMHELAFGMTGINIFEGTPLNPKWPNRIPGGSSSGSAAVVAAELVDFAIGTDTGGSVRQPAICCGVIGFKPTFGRVSRSGASPVKSSLDCVGPFAASLDMIERAMCIIDPSFEREEFHGPLRIARICIGPETKPEMAQACKALQLGDPDRLGEVDLPTLGEAFSAGMTIIASETLAANVHLLGTEVPLGSDIRKRLEAAQSLTDENVARSEGVRLRFTAEVDALLEQYDAIVTPAMPVEPPLLSDASDSANVLSLTRFLRPFNLSGHPSIVLPTVTSAGLPSGVQIVGRKGEDARLCAIARRLSKANPIFQIKE